MGVTKHGRVGASAAVYMTAVLEFLTAEVFDFAGNAVLMKGTLAGGGVIPHIHNF